VPRKKTAATKGRPPLSRERVLQAALALVDEGGLDALSMRKLAQELGVEAMSLYNHVENKDDIVGGILELVAGEVEIPADDSDWKTALRLRGISAHDAFSRHRWAAGIWMSSRRGGRSGMRDGEAILRLLREAGFSSDLTYHAFHVFNGYVLGFTIQELNFPYDREQLKTMAATFLDDFPVDDFPYLAEHITQHVEPGDHHQSEFAFGLELILDGLERLRDAA
jgi:AcrR family transcriptional regulator